MKPTESRESYLSMHVERETAAGSGVFTTRLSTVVILGPDGKQIRAMPHYNYPRLDKIGSVFAVAIDNSDDDIRKLQTRRGLNAIVMVDSPGIYSQVIFHHGTDGLYEYTEVEGSRESGASREDIGIIEGGSFSGLFCRGFKPGQKEYYEVGQNLDGKLVRVCFRDIRTP